MRVILTMAISANGMIATKDGSEDFLSHVNWQQFVKLANKVGCFVWGRKTYESVITWGEEYLEPLKDVRKGILSESEVELEEEFILAHSPEEALQLLGQEGFEEVLVSGGATVNSEFAKRGLIDEVILDVNPAAVGDGIPVFAWTDFMMNLRLKEVMKLEEGIVELRYEVVE